MFDRQFPKKLMTGLLGMVKSNQARTGENLYESTSLLVTVPSLFQLLYSYAMDNFRNGLQKKFLPAAKMGQLN
jgi:hypothetical protein